MKIDKDTRIYIAGCGGMLGEAVYRKFSTIAQVKATDIDLNEEWLENADVRNYQELLKSVKEFKPNIIMNLAAITDMELCEIEQENAWLTNTLGAENLGLIANELDVPYVYISTAGIFGGEKEYFNDFDSPNPLSCYAKSKYAGEVFVQQNVKKYYVIRAGWMLGGGLRKDKKFINKIYQQIVRGNRFLYVVDDKLGTPTYTVDFANGLYNLVCSDLYGTYNMVCEGSGSRFDVSYEFVRLLGLEKNINIEKVSSEFFKVEYFAPRPKSEKLLNLKLTARGLNNMRDWRACLKEYSNIFIEDLKKKGYYDKVVSSSYSDLNIIKPLNVHIFSEAPSPHNNYLFGTLGNENDITLFLYYIYTSKNVPQRPWKTFSESIENQHVRSAVSKIIDLKILFKVFKSSPSKDIFFIIGWNHLSLYLTILLLGLQKKPFLMWFDTPRFDKPLKCWNYRTILKKIIIRFINRGNGTIFVTGKFALNAYKEIGIKFESLKMLPFFVPQQFIDNNYLMERDKLRRKQNIRNEQIIFLAGGRLIYSKGYDILIEAIRLIDREILDKVKIIIIGYGDQEKLLVNKINENQLGNIIDIIPWVEPQELEKYMQICDVFIAPARFDPFPTTVIQAMGHAKTVIASNRVFSALEFIEDGINGYIFPYENPLALSNKIVKLIKNNKLIEQMGKAAYVTIQSWPVSRGVMIIKSALQRIQSSAK